MREVDRLCSCGHAGSDHAELGPCMMAYCACESGRVNVNVLVRETVVESRVIRERRET